MFTTWFHSHQVDKKFQRKTDFSSSRFLRNHHHLWYYSDGWGIAIVCSNKCFSSVISFCLHCQTKKSFCIFINSICISVFPGCLFWSFLCLFSAFSCNLLLCVSTSVSLCMCLLPSFSLHPSLWQQCNVSTHTHRLSVWHSPDHREKEDFGLEPKWWTSAATVCSGVLPEGSRSNFGS